MSLLNDKFQLVTKDPLPGAYGSIWDVLVPKEISDAQSTGSGPGVPDATGTVALGSVVSGRMMEMDAFGHLIDGNSPDLTAAFRKMFWVVFEGDNSFSSAQAGNMTAVHGGCRVETTQFNVASSYTPGLPLIVVSGQLQPKALATDGFQSVGYVGPKGVTSDGVLDAYLVQG